VRVHQHALFVCSQQGQSIGRSRGGYDNLAGTYLAFIQLASIRLWLRINESVS
jgi:transposase